MSLEATDNWLGRHADSPAARALETTEPWVARRWRRWRRDEVRFPRPDEVDDVDEALAWAWRAERYASELTSTALLAEMFLSAVFGAFLASLILSLKQGEENVAILGVGVCVFLIVIRFSDIALFSDHQHVWLRRAAAIRQRADQLAAAVPPPTAPAPCLRWCCRLRNESAA